MIKIKKKIRNLIKHLLLERGFRLQQVNHFDFLNQLLYKIIQKKEQVKYIQIGANDGKRFDPIYDFIRYNHSKTSGLVVEPVKDYYLALRKNLKNFPKIIQIQKAIHNTQKSMKIYKVDEKFESKVPEFAMGIASFDKDHHTKTNIPEHFMSFEEVSCITFDDLVDTYHFRNANVLVIDTEGYDYEILKNIDFQHFNPYIIHFEHGLKTKTMSIEQFKEITQLLSSKNYQLFINESDVTAYQTDLFFDYQQNA